MHRTSKLLALLLVALSCGPDDSSEPQIVIEDPAWWVGTWSYVELPLEGAVLVASWTLQPDGVAVWSMHQCGKDESVVEGRWEPTEDGESVELLAAAGTAPFGGGPQAYLTVRSQPTNDCSVYSSDDLGELGTLWEYGARCIDAVENCGAELVPFCDGEMLAHPCPGLGE